jgi:hypothetical protein
MKKSLLFLTLMAGICSNPALAHNHDNAEYMKMRQAQFIDRYDSDRDSKVSSVEFEQARRERFDITDENKNGTVSEEEYVYEWEDRLDARLSKDRASTVFQTSRRFAALDENGDLTVSWLEHNASGERMYDRQDTDKNGEINAADTEREYKSTEPVRVLTTEQKSLRQEILADRANRVVRMPSTHTREGMLSKYDLDHDSVITREEFDASRQNAFKLTDANNNGSLDEEEYVLEFEDRLDAQIARTRADSVKQAGRRFKALDKNEDELMTFAEYQNSGHSMFKRWDAGADGYVSVTDSLPKPRVPTAEQIAATDDNSPDKAVTN